MLFAMTEHNQDGQQWYSGIDCSLDGGFGGLEASKFATNRQLVDLAKLHRR